MKFTLKDYQTDAVDAVLKNLRKARKRWREERELNAFSLSATTGAGKTVMAAAVFEALFHGNDGVEFEGDPGAVVIWFSDDPALNEQTRFRLQEASDRLLTSDLVVVQHPFNREKLGAGKVYFLNTQKLSRNSLLVRGHDPEEEEARLRTVFETMRPDATAYTIWDTIQNTIEDPALTLYLVLDEAHRGLGSQTQAEISNRSTIVRRLINGAGGASEMPIVWGISATVERFNTAMQGAEGRTTLTNVVVDSAKVQASGLLKDTIVLDMPEDVGRYDSVLLRRATRKAVEATKEWAQYARDQKDPNTVLPLMVLQVPNTPDANEIATNLALILEGWPELTSEGIAHVFGDHATQQFGPYSVPYISPERVQDSTWVRVLLAKDAINTGWDCPRAEVMVSFRAAQDQTHITQLIGRMVRTPLARRIPGNDILNSVTCILPFFNKDAAERVVRSLEGGGDADADTLTGRRVLINPVGLYPNPKVPPEVLGSFLSLPSQCLPQKGAKPIKRLTALAHELAADAILPDAGKLAHRRMHEVLTNALERYADRVAAERVSIETVTGVTVTANMLVREQRSLQFEEVADFATIEDFYLKASRIISPDLARTFVEAIAANDLLAGSPEDALDEAHLQLAALGLVPELKPFLEDEADSLANSWFSEHGQRIRGLTDERQDVYRQLRAWSQDPGDVDLAKPANRLEKSAAQGADGAESPLLRFDRHLLSDADGLFPIELFGPEEAVLRTELARHLVVAWYRNPSHPSPDSLGIAYSQGGETKIVRPDFLFFTEVEGAIVPHIIDPHGTHLSDALPKIRGLAAYAESHRHVFGRVETVAEIDGVLRVLDLTAETTRVAARAASDARQLYVTAGQVYAT